jgi:lipoate-protein ligase A
VRQTIDPSQPAGSLRPAARTPGMAAVAVGPEAPAEWLAAALPTVAANLALDEALLEAAHEGRLPRPVVRTWMAAAPAVVVGSSSRIEEEVDREACEREGVPILRRPSGGLTVVLGPGCLMWTVVAPVAAAAPAIDRIHAAVLEPLVAALVAAGRPIVRRGSSDLAVVTADGERKVSGNALRVRRGGVLYHGTLLDAFDLGLVGRVLRHPPREPAYRARRNHAAFLANLGLGRTVLDAAVRQAFAATGDHAGWPEDRVAELVRERYTSPAWTERLG